MNKSISEYCRGSVRTRMNAVEVAMLRKECYRLQLEGASMLSRFTDEELVSMCHKKDGSMIWVMDAAYEMDPWIVPAALIMLAEISILRYSVSKIEDAVCRMRRNGMLIARRSAKWWSFRRYVMMWDAVVYSNICYCCQSVPQWSIWGYCP